MKNEAVDWRLSVPWWIRSPIALTSWVLGCAYRNQLDGKHIMLLRYDPARDVYYQLRGPGWYTMSREWLENGLLTHIDIHSHDGDWDWDAMPEAAYDQVVGDAFALLRQVTSLDPGETLDLLPNKVFL